MSLAGLLGRSLAVNVESFGLSFLHSLDCGAIDAIVRCCDESAVGINHAIHLRYFRGEFPAGPPHRKLSYRKSLQESPETAPPLVRRPRDTIYVERRRYPAEQVPRT